MCNLQKCDVETGNLQYIYADSGLFSNVGNVQQTSETKFIYIFIALGF